MTEEKYEVAREIFKKAVEINSKFFDARIHLGNAYANLGQFDEAIAVFKSALIIDSKSGEALFSLGNLYLLMEQTPSCKTISPLYTLICLQKHPINCSNEKAIYIKYILDYNIKYTLYINLYLSQNYKSKGGYRYNDIFKNQNTKF